MKFSAVFAVSSIFAGAFAAPAAQLGDVSNVGNVANTANAQQVLKTVTGLYSQVQQYTGAINSTAANLGPASTLAQNQTAAQNYQEHVQKLTTLISQATSKVQQTAGSAGSAASGLQSRQLGNSELIGGVLSNVMLEVNGALNKVEGTLGVGSLLGLASPLETELTGLLSGVEAAVGQVLSTVKSILGGVLPGLGLNSALSGLIGSNGILGGLTGGLLGGVL